jgi:hypothetical protein
MPQLALFEGPHLPRTAAREALSRGELAEARAQLVPLAGATAEAADGARLGRITAALRATNEDPVTTLHAAFASALAMAEPRGFLSNDEWFRLYAQRMARVLDAEPARRFRGWLGAHFALVAGEADAARRAAHRIVETQPPGPAWLEASRIAFVLAEAASARSWIHAACLDGPTELAAEPPALAHSGVSALDAAPSLPRLPPPVEELFEAVRTLDDLPGRRTRWVAVLGEIDRVLAPAAPSDGEPAESPAPDDDEVRAFLAALRAARRSRERDGARGPDRCSDRELRSRRRMQHISPVLLARYLRGLGGALI